MNFLSKYLGRFVRERLIIIFVILHLAMIMILGDLVALAPDEAGYLTTFNNLYILPMSTFAQTSSGWITAPTIFLWVVYAPAKLLTILGISNLVAIRVLSVMLTVASLYFLKNVLNHRQTNTKKTEIVLVLFYLIPSVFLWTSIGLREAFIIAQLSSILFGLTYIFRGKNMKGSTIIFLASYGLISTKNYLWACVVVAILLSSLVFLVQKVSRRRILLFISSGIFLPLLLFVGTTSSYALDFIFNSDINAAGERSGDSITQVAIEIPSTGSTGSTGSTTEIITFHGDYTLIALHFYLVDNPRAPLSRVFQILNFDSKVDEIWKEKLDLGLISSDKQVGSESSSLSGHILEPGDLRNPISVVKAGFNFLFGPVPFTQSLGFASTIAALESPIWWLFYFIILWTIIKFKHHPALFEPTMVFSFILFVGFVAFSALVEVNLGTSFRHRSILLVPLAYMYVYLNSKTKESA